MRVGLFGGTFDPVHNGHLRVAEEVREHFGLEKLYFIPASVQPLKRHTKVSVAVERMKMLRMAIRSNKFFYASPVEIQRGGISYSIETINVFAAQHDEVYFLVGLDAFSEIDQWKDYRRIFEETHLVILARPVHARVDYRDLFPPDVKPDVRIIDDTTYEHRCGKTIFFHRVTQLDVSSTMIRQLAHRGASIKYLVPYSVERYIKQGGLYTK